MPTPPEFVPYGVKSAVLLAFFDDRTIDEASVRAVRVNDVIQ